MKFPYFKVPSVDSKRKWISRPMISVLITGPKKSVIVDALIDSGADKCLFHADIGREIGLDLEKGEREVFSGIENGKIASYVHKIHLQIVGMENVKIEVPTGFVDSPGIFAILGQEGFFDKFKIKFEKDHNAIEIIPSKKK